MSYDHDENSHEEAGGEGSGLAILGDLMTSLMVVFALLFLVLVNNAGTRGKATRDELLDILRERLASQQIPPEYLQADPKDPLSVLLITPADLLFGQNEYTLRPGGVEYLNRVTPVLAQTLCSADVRSRIDGVIVEGHTDTTYAGGRLARGGPQAGRAYNLHLSQQRSMSTIAQAISQLSALDMAAQNCFLNLVSASGRGQESPLPGVPGDDPRQRRVVFKIRSRGGDLALPAGEMPPSSPPSASRGAS